MCVELCLKRKPLGASQARAPRGLREPRRRAVATSARSWFELIR